MKRQAKEILPTMKIDADSENELDIPYVECQVTIEAISDVETKKYGKKTLATVRNSEAKRFNVFINNFSMQNLIDSFGDEDKAWIGKVVNLVKEKDENYDTDMIVIQPIN